MIIRFSGPFENLAGKEITIPLDRKITLRELLEILSRRYPGFQPYAEKKTDADLFAQAAFVCQGRPLKLDEIINDEDILYVLLPAVGG